jgi:hypothetical protein
LKDLDEQGTKEFYDWFAEFQPRSPVIDGPGVPGAHPPFDLDNSSGSGLLDGLNTPSNTTESTSPDSGAEEVPAKSADKKNAPAVP